MQAYGQPADVAGCQMNRANALASQGRYAEAVAGHEAALRLFQAHGLPASVAGCQMNRAKALESQGRYAEAVAGYDAVDISSLEPDARRKAHKGIGDALWKLGERDSAMDQYRAARRAMRRARRLARVDETRYEFLDQQRGLVRESVRCALEANRADEAFAAVQDGKAGMLGEMRRRSHECADDEPAAVIAARAGFTDLLRNPPDPDATRNEWAKWNVERTRLAAEFLDGWGRHHHAYRER
jgi:tetratricopeptide (TPR) repeat protein